MMKIARTTALVVALSASASIYAANIDQVVAVVGESAILQSDLDQASAVIQEQMQSQGQQVPSASILRKQVLEQLILRQAQIEQVRRLGVKPSETELNQAVLSIAKQQGADSLEEFQRGLDSQRAGNYELLRKQVSEDLSVNRLRQQQVMSRIKVSERDIDNFLNSPQGQAALGSKVHVLHLRVAPKSEATEANVVTETANAVRNALATSDNIKEIAEQNSNDQVVVQGADMGTRALSDIPADLAARISGLEVGKTTELINAKDGIHILKLLERTADGKKALVPQYFTRHILIQPSEVVSPADAKQQIDQIYSRLQQGADFQEMAATYSSDTGSARNGGSLDWVSPGVMVPEFEKMMTSTSVGQVSKPFQTQYGWHILTVEDQRQKDMTEEYQRRMAKQLLSERQFDAELDGWLREVRAEAYVDIKDPSLKDADAQASSTPPTTEPSTDSSTEN
ncbi:peptidylprolyl isomerase [Acinetobacter sp. A3.8]|uniref:Chaperone SurA n=1 Tax=Acinetobacter sedimenti TaxID=2919922 RepID=A0A9X2BAG6_9GAMM|nr:peptidylprolyl isomerase [Acinetobacter sedimenti]MCJ8146575.1 peptidylprolyl isomerase [Acinetobacter sedimenti]